MKKQAYIYIIAGVFLIAAIASNVYLYTFSHQPLSRKLILEPRPSAIISPISEGSASIITSTITPRVDTTTSGEGEVCGQSGAYTILIIGSDTSDLRGRPGSDLTRLARIDFSHKKVGIFALPRDLWVDVNGLGFRNPPITETALGMAYYEAFKRSLEVEESGRITAGAQALAQMILDNFEVASDHYAVMDLSQLPALVDTIDGLPIDIPERTTDPWIGMVIEAGPQTLSGVQLMAYARAIPDSDFNRIQRNNLILNALREKLLDPSVWIKLPTLYDQFKQMFITDLSPQQMFSLFCLLREIPRNEIVMEQVKPEWTSPGPSDSLLWDKERVISGLKELGLHP